MHTRGVAKWQSRRKISLGPVRRACPASGASWNVQIVRGKMTSRCLWHACRALALGLVLMMIGAGMATIGYYAEHISSDTEARNNSTIRIKTDSKGIHLHNLSYAGPIVMGCGGFIIVAACVMTFEARDSAAKVVPARFKLSTNTRSGTRLNSARRTTALGGISTTQAVGSQTNRWDNQLGVFRTSPIDNAQTRVAQTAALVHFSKMLGTPTRHLPKERRVSRSGSVPNLASCNRPSIIQQNSTSPTQRPQPHFRITKTVVHDKSVRSRVSTAGHTRLNALHTIRHGTSFDETGPYHRHKASFDSQNSQISMGKENCEYSSKRDRTKRSDTAKKHVLARQKKIDNVELQNINAKSCFVKSRSNSTNSDISNVFRKGIKQSSTVSRTPSVDSKSVQTDNTVREKIIIASPNRKSSALVSQAITPCVDGKFRSQMSICSEPAPAPTYQLSVDQVLAEENPRQVNCPIQDTDNDSISNEIISPKNDETIPVAVKRPDTLILNCNRNRNDNKQEKIERNKKYLYRSNSSNLHKRPSLVSITATTSSKREFDQIYFISSNKDDDNYDSIEVIDERRMKNLPKSEKARLYKSNTFICEEYYTQTQANSANEEKCESNNEIEEIKK